MHYRAVGNRCSIDYREFSVHLSEKDLLELLAKNGFQKIEVDTIALARSLAGKAQYRRSAKLSEAPEIFDCSSLAKWLYGQKGIWLPRRTIQQMQSGIEVFPSEIKEGDIVLTSGLVNYYHIDPSEGVGHVGIATHERTIIHAASSKVGIVESPLDSFVKKGLRSVRRMIPEDAQIHTFLTPPEREVESSEDIYWIVLQNL